MVLTHGAGSNSNAPLLVALAAGFSAKGLAVLRCDLPYRQARRTGPPRPAEAALDREGLKRAVAVMRRIAPGGTFLGGQSYGGRQASMAAAESPQLADALLLLSYPLHPPGRPAQLRTAHFRALEVPALFAHGSMDPFGGLAELDAARALIPAPTALLAFEGAGHGLGSGRGGRPAERTVERIVDRFLSFVEHKEGSHERRG
jgi:predicted alpha/beta-hydrolase family hydrolase